MVGIWLLLGLFGWASLMLFRRATDKGHIGINFLSYLRGFILSLLIGPFCFAFLIMLIINHLDKRSK